MRISASGSLHWRLRLSLIDSSENTSGSSAVGMLSACQSDEAFWDEFRRSVLPLGPSQYDITSICNLSCEGCLFFSGSDYLGHRDLDDLAAVDAFFAAEAARGVRYGYFGGAEPSLVEGKLVAAGRHLPYGVVFTNGTRRLSDEIGYRIHISVWGRPERSKALRGADMLSKQIRNYRGDPRAVFVFTINAQNIEDITWVAEFCADNDVALTFNHYSPTSKYLAYLNGRSDTDAFHARNSEGEDLLLGPRHLSRAREIIDGLLNAGHGRILYDRMFNHLIHDPAGLYPALDPDTGVARDCGVVLSPSLRHYNTDLSQSSGKCCTPNIECGTCRLYAQSFATVLARATRRMRNPDERIRTIRLWRLWCAVFLNDPRFTDWRPTDTLSVS